MLSEPNYLFLALILFIFYIFPFNFYFVFDCLVMNLNAHEIVD